MTQEQADRYFEAETWLMRTWDDDKELEQLVNRREELISSMSGIGKYDSKSVPGGCDPNPTEAKNLEYSRLTAEIEKIEQKISTENTKTLEVIYKINEKTKDASKVRGMLIGRYLNHLSWRKVGELYHYQERHSYNYRVRCLNAIYPFIPKEEIINERR